MSIFKTISHDLMKSLELRYEPVGVTLYLETDPIPQGLPFTPENLKSYCQALTLAGEGRTLFLKKEQMGCKLGTSVLGFEKDMAEYLDDGVLEKYGVGLFGSEEASAATILKATYLEKGKTQAALVAPLAFFQERPQVVVFTADSEQVMWLLYALNYEKGGRMDLPQSGGALGGCADITALPLLKGAPNVTFLGLGCRLKAAVDPGHLMMGTPGSTLAAIHTHILDMAKPIAMLKNARSGVSRTGR
ncbi:MAG: DUF169 domain-containing protein [Desulfobaccales bacterium]|nr:DUF169 domain-containing protein [Desulfobaccales bacterium]